MSTTTTSSASYANEQVGPIDYTNITLSETDIGADTLNLIDSGPTFGSTTFGSVPTFDGIEWDALTAGTFGDTTGDLQQQVLSFSYTMSAGANGEIFGLDSQIIGAVIYNPDPGVTFTAVATVTDAAGDVVATMTFDPNGVDTPTWLSTGYSTLNVNLTVTSTITNPGVDMSNDAVIFSGIQETAVAGSASIDKQVSVDGGKTWYDVGDGVLQDPSTLVGGTVEYRVIVTNDSSSGISLANAEVNDINGPGPFTFGGSTTFSLASGNVITSDVMTATAVAGHQIDTATLTGSFTDGMHSIAASASDTADYTATSPGTTITVDKQVSLDGKTWYDIGSGVLNNPSVMDGCAVYVRVVVTNTSSATVTGALVEDSNGQYFTFNNKVTTSCQTLRNCDAGSGKTLWLSSCFNPASTANGACYSFNNITAQICSGGKTYTEQVPNCQVVFSSACRQASTVYNASTNCWVTTLPAGQNCGNVFLSGLPVQVPSGCDFSNASVTWSIGSSTNNCGTSNLNWQTSASSYSNFCQGGNDGCANYNNIGVQSCDNSGQGSGWGNYGGGGYGYGNGGAGCASGQSGWGNCGSQQTQNCGTVCSSYSVSTTTTIAAGATVTSNVMTLTAVAGHQIDTATLTGTETLSGQTVSVTGSDTADYTGLAPSISVLKVPGAVAVASGEQETYTFYVSNTGTAPLYDVQISDNIGTAANPDDVTPSAVTSGGYNVGDVNHNGVLDAGEVWTYTETVTASAGSGGGSGNGGSSGWGSSGNGWGGGSGNACGSDDDSSSNWGSNGGGWGEDGSGNACGSGDNSNSNWGGGWNGSSGNDCGSGDGGNANCGSGGGSSSGATSVTDVVTVTAATAAQGQGTGGCGSSSGSTCSTATVTASDAKEIQVVGSNSNITIGGTAPSGNLSTLYGAADKLEFTYNPGDTVSLASGSKALASVTGATPSANAFLEITSGTTPNASGAQIYFEGNVTAGENIFADATINPLTGAIVTGSSSAFSTAAGAELHAFVFASQQAFQAGAAPTQTLAYGSAGQMNLGDTIGSLKLAGYVGTNGGHLVV